MHPSLRRPLFLAAGMLLAAPLPALAIGGLTGSYFLYDGGYLEDFTFSDPGYHHMFDRVDPDIAFGYSQEHYEENNGNGLGFDWEPFGPGAGAFGVRWTGLLTVPEGRSIFLGTESDDGSYVFINDQLFVDNGGQHWPWYRWSRSQLTPGSYRISTYLFANDLTPPHDKSGIDLWWSTDQYVVNASGWVPGDWLTPMAVADAGSTPPAPTPEPGTLALLLTGLGSAGIAARRRRSL